MSDLQFDKLLRELKEINRSLKELAVAAKSLVQTIEQQKAAEAAVKAGYIDASKFS